MKSIEHYRKELQRALRELQANQSTFLSGFYSGKKRVLEEIIDDVEQPIDMILYCPKCHAQHIDLPQELCRKTDPTAFLQNKHCWSKKGHDGPCNLAPSHHLDALEKNLWKNPPHRSHLCQSCGHIWRPADVATNGVQEIKTKGKADS